MSHILSSVCGTSADTIPIKRALLSVSDKTGLVELATTLKQLYRVELLSTGGTAKILREAGLQVTDVSDYTGSPEILNGRVKTLHPKVHGALLSVRGNPKHEQEMSDCGIIPIDLVVMNLYPFQATVGKGSDWATCVENVDIGGPSMLRAAAKNHAYVAALSSPQQYPALLQQLQQHSGATSLQARKFFAAQAFAASAAYDAAIASYFAAQVDVAPAEAQATHEQQVVRCYQHQVSLKYGCNPHQKPAALLSHVDAGGSRLPFAVVNGTPGYINLLDAVFAWQLVRELSAALDGVPAAASFKHCSPAGAAVGTVPLSVDEAAAYEVADPSVLSPTALAYVRARNADPMCSFGDFAAISHTVDVATAKVFKVEVCDGIVAPDFEPEALEILRAKKKGAFILLRADPAFVPPSQELRELFGVAFLQRRNDCVFSAATHLRPDQVVVKPHGQGEALGLSAEAQRDLVVASVAIKFTQSNSVGYAHRGQMVGVGAGQQSRVDCVKLAGRKVAVWYLRQHPKVLSLPFKVGVKRQDRVNARVRYIEGDFTAAERVQWRAHFDSEPAPLSSEEKDDFLRSLDGVCISSDAFFPFRDSIDHASKFGVKFIAQPGGSVADEEVKAACREYGMTMAFTNLRLFLH